MSFLTWPEISEKYKDQWVAITKWEEDEHGDVLRGEVSYCAPHRKPFYDYINKHFANQDLAIRYTGDVEGPFFIGL